MIGRIAFALGITTACVGLVTALPVLDTTGHQSSIPPSPSPSKRQTSDDPSCSIQGNADFYGLGIRIGIYLQYITAFLANHILRDAIKSNLETNSIFLLALFIATIVATVSGEAQTAELVVLLHLCFGFLFSILSIWGHRTSTTDSKEEKIRFPLIGSFFRLSLATAISAYGLWFWFWGRELHARQSACQDYTFLFTRLDITSGVQYFLEVQSSAVLVVYSVLFIREFCMIIAFFVFVGIQTLLISGFVVWFRGSKADKKSDRHAGEEKIVQPNTDDNEPMIDTPLALIKQWISLSTAIGWKRANGKESAGSHRPDLDFYLVPMLDCWILILQIIIQFFCLVVFKSAPKVDCIPLFRHPVYAKIQAAKQGKRSARWAKKIKALYESPETERCIYAANLICIIWTIISVELTLYWNQITDVYTLRSTGQLIPFIIGVFGFLSLLHSVSVERSNTRSTDVLLKILDSPGPVRPDASSEHETASVSPAAMEIFPLAAAREAVFFVRKPRARPPDETQQGAFYKRRHSINIITEELIQQDAEEEQDPTAMQEENHLDLLHDLSRLQARYPLDNIDSYTCKANGLEFGIVKHFRKVRGGDDSTASLSRSRRSRRGRRRSPSTSIATSRRSGSRGSRSSRSGLSTVHDELPDNDSQNIENQISPRRRRSMSVPSSRGSNPAVAPAKIMQSDVEARSVAPSRSATSASSFSSPSRSRSRGRSRSSSGGSGGGWFGKILCDGGSSLLKTALSFRTFQRIAGRSKTLAMAYAVFCVFALLPLALCAFLLRKPLKALRPRLIYALQEVLSRSLQHYQQVVMSRFLKTDTPEPSNRDRGKVLQNYVALRQPHRRTKEQRPNAGKFLDAFRSRSLSKLMNVTSGISKQYLLECGMPKSAEYVSDLMDWFEIAKETRARRNAKEISAFSQHQILAEFYHKHISGGLIETLQKEAGAYQGRNRQPKDIENAVKDNSEPKVSGTGNDRPVVMEEKHGSTINVSVVEEAKTTATSDGNERPPILKRWYSWSGQQHRESVQVHRKVIHRTEEEQHSQRDDFGGKGGESR